MPRLPQPGSDAGNWGNILNDFLSTTHDTNGNLKAGSVDTTALADSSVTLAKLAISGAPSAGQTLSYDGTNLSWTTPSGSGSVPDATSSVKGLVQLAGDLGGTAAAPTVPGLAAKADSASVVTIAGTQTVTGQKNFTGGLQSAGAVVVTTGDARLSDQRTPVDGSVTTAKLVDNNITEPKLAVSNSPATNQVLSWSGSTLTWVTPSSGSSDPAVGGDLSGTASNAQIVAGAVGTTELAANAVTAAKIIDNTITEPKLAISNAPGTNQVLSWDGTNLTWVTPASGGGGGSVWNAVSKSGNYTASSGDFVVCDTTSSGFTITLPAPANGAYVSVKKKTNNVNAVLVAPPSGVIDAGSNTSSTIAVNSYGQVADFVADGTTWNQVG
jgi:hypothetical protein